MTPKLRNKREAEPVVAPTTPTLLTEDDLYLFNEGSHFRLYDKLGAHALKVGGVDGTYFAVWAPGAEYVSVIGDFNNWDKGKNPLKPRGSSGIWEGFAPGATKGNVYKYHVASRYNGYTVDKADPMAFYSEVPPRTGSVVWDMAYTWNDSQWMAERHRRNALDAPINIYELHVGSWRRVPEEGNRSLTYREMAEPLAKYLNDLGYTHVEFLPITEYPFFGSWGYQVTGYYAPTSRFGTPQDLMYLIDYLHQKGIGVFLDWVPSHFPMDLHGLIYFDGTHAYEHSDPQQRIHRDWDTAIFNYGRHEVRSFLISSALFWLDKYHIDGLRVDAVASMLYLDYSRKEGEWTPNRYGGRENIEAIDFIRRMNEEVYRRHPDVQMIAEESTAWGMVSRPTYVGGLGFGLKWDMGWMHDTLLYFCHDPIHRRYHHGELTFRMIYAFNENFVLALSHDEVVHGKGALLSKMPGDFWQKFANLRLLYGYMYAQPGKKLLFMGGEIGQWDEWHHERSLDWHLLQWPPHQGISACIRDLNRLSAAEPALHEIDFDQAGFEWIDHGDAENSVLCWLRKGKDPTHPILAVCNFTPVPRQGYRVGVAQGGFWKEIFNSDAQEYWGSGMGNCGGLVTEDVSWHGRPLSLNVTLPPLGVVLFKHQGEQ